MKKSIFRIIAVGAVVSIVMMTSSISAGCTDYSTSDELNEQFEDFNRDIATQGVSVDKNVSTVDPKQAFPTGNSETTSQTVTDDSQQANSDDAQLTNSDDAKSDAAAQESSKGSALTSSGDKDKKTSDGTTEQTESQKNSDADNNTSDSTTQNSENSQNSPETTESLNAAKSADAVESSDAADAVQTAETPETPQSAESAQSTQSAQPAQGKYPIAGLVVTLAVIVIMISGCIMVKIRKRK